MHQTWIRKILARCSQLSVLRVRAVPFGIFAILSVTGCAHLPSATGGVPLRVMTYNIRSGNGDLTRTADAIRASAPDLVALQEVDVHWAQRSGFADQASELGDRLHMQVRFARIYSLPATDSAQPSREFGVALLSRYPIRTWRNDTLTRLSTQEKAPVPQPMPGLLEAEVDVHGTTVRVFNTHLDYRSDPRVRQQQVTEMLAYIGEPSVPTLVFGDMNAKQDAPELQLLLRRLHDTWPASAGPGLTYPAEAPAERIDYVLILQRDLADDNFQSRQHLRGSDGDARFGDGDGRIGWAAQ